MSDDLLPKRLCIETNSKYFCAAASVIGVRLDGEIVNEVVEYQVGRTEDDGFTVNGWVRVGHRMTNGRLRRTNLNGQKFATTTLYGEVKPYYRTEVSRQMRRQLSRVGK